MIPLTAQQQRGRLEFFVLRAGEKIIKLNISALGLATLLSLVRNCFLVGGEHIGFINDD